MANRLFGQQMQYYGAAPVTACTHFTANSTSAPLTSTLVSGGGPQFIASFAYTATGIITVTCADAMPAVMAVFAQVDDSAAAGVQAFTSDITNEGNGSPITFKIRLRDNTGAAVAPGTQRIGVFVWFQNTAGWGA